MTYKQFVSEIRLPSPHLSDSSPHRHYEENNEDEMTIYFFHSTYDDDQSNGNSGVWSLDGTLDEGHPRPIPWPDIEISEWEYVLLYYFEIPLD